MIRRLLRAYVYCAYLTPLLVLVGYLYLHREETLGNLLPSSSFLTLPAALSLLFLVSRATFLNWIDRSFAREEPDRRVEVDFLKRASRPPKIQTPPGIHLRSFARLVFSKKSFELVIEPTLRDLFDEYCEALDDHHPGKAQWIRLRGYFSFWSAVFKQIPLSLTKLVVTVWKSIQ
jgi:hypothetical protein